MKSGKRNCGRIKKTELFSTLEDVQLSERGRFMALFSLVAGYLDLYEHYEIDWRSMEEDEYLRSDMTQVRKEYAGLSDQEVQECFAALQQFGPTLFNQIWWIKYE